MTQLLIREARPGDESGMHEAQMRSIREVCIRDHGEEEVKGWGNRPLGDRWQKQVREGAHGWLSSVVVTCAAGITRNWRL
jgi:hypothetical protein